MLYTLLSEANPQQLWKSNPITLCYKSNTVSIELLRCTALFINCIKDINKARIKKRTIIYKLSTIFKEEELSKAQLTIRIHVQMCK